VYDETRRALAGQLGIERSPQLRQLRQQILISNGTAKARFDLPRDVSELYNELGVAEADDIREHLAHMKPSS
jgi:hypothetical protein